MGLRVAGERRFACSPGGGRFAQEHKVNLPPSAAIQPFAPAASGRQP